MLHKVKVGLDQHKPIAYKRSIFKQNLTGYSFIKSTVNLLHIVIDTHLAKVLCSQASTLI